MKTRKFLTAAIIVTGIIATMSSCKKDDDMTPTPTPTLEPIALECDYFWTDQTLVDDPNRAVDYFIDCVMEVRADIKVNPGVVVEFGQAAGVHIKPIGSFSAEGEEGNEILFTGKDKTKGSWKGFLFDSDNTNNSLNHTKVSYAGDYTSSNGDESAVLLWADTKLEMRGLTIDNSSTYGLNANYRGTEIILENVTITDCDKAPILITQLYLGDFGSGGNYTGNGQNFIHVEVNTDKIVEDITIRNVGVPYRVFPYDNGFREITIDGGTTTIEEDLTIEFTNGTGIFIDDNGTLDVSSDGLNGVVFTGVNKTAGSWRGIYIQFTAGANSLQDLTIEYAGSESDGENGGIQMWADPVLSVGDVTFSNVEGCALLDRPKDPMDPANPNFSDLGGNSYDNVSGGNYCKVN